MMTVSGTQIEHKAAKTQGENAGVFMERILTLVFSVWQAGYLTLAACGFAMTTACPTACPSAKPCA